MWESGGDSSIDDRLWGIHVFAGCRVVDSSHLGDWLWAMSGKVEYFLISLRCLAFCL